MRPTHSCPWRSRRVRGLSRSLSSYSDLQEPSSPRSPRELHPTTLPARPGGRVRERRTTAGGARNATVRDRAPAVNGKLPAGCQENKCYRISIASSGRRRGGTGVRPPDAAGTPEHGPVGKPGLARALRRWVAAERPPAATERPSLSPLRSPRGGNTSQTGSLRRLSPRNAYSLGHAPWPGPGPRAPRSRWARDFPPRACRRIRGAAGSSVWRRRASASRRTPRCGPEAPRRPPAEPDPRRRPRGRATPPPRRAPSAEGSQGSERATLRPSSRRSRGPGAPGRWPATRGPWRGARG